MNQINELVLSANAREGIVTILDALIPGTDILPSGREVEAHLSLLDRALVADPSLLPLIEEAALRASTESTISVRMLQDWFSDDAERIVFTLHAAYYMSPAVRAALDYPGQQRFPISEATPDQLCSDELIDPVISRGPIFIPTPE